MRIFEEGQAGQSVFKRKYLTQILILRHDALHKAVDFQGLK